MSAFKVRTWHDTLVAIADDVQGRDLNWRFVVVRERGIEGFKA